MDPLEPPAPQLTPPVRPKIPTSDDLNAMRPGPLSPVHVTPLTPVTDEPEEKHPLPSVEDKGEEKPVVHPEAQGGKVQLDLPEEKNETTDKADGDGKGHPRSSAAHEKVEKVSDAPPEPEHKGSDDVSSKRKAKAEESKGEPAPGLNGTLCSAYPACAPRQEVAASGYCRCWAGGGGLFGRQLLPG